MKIFAVALLVCCALALPAKSQIFTNSGAVISAGAGAVMLINGNAQLLGGEISLGDRAELRINGTLNFDAGLTIFNAASMGIVSGDCFIGTKGELRRLGTGTLYLNRFTRNRGLIINDGVIEYGMP
ncbi:hypothetical protein MASR2M18_01790 [Ignavibacteria bacterium]|nr:hypothetical protein [Bacteroidota bacterium]MCZ2132750.1 hypothetical protein [Bacteroidota bacterium]